MLRKIYNIFCKGKLRTKYSESKERASRNSYSQNIKGTEIKLKDFCKIQECSARRMYVKLCVWKMDRESNKYWSNFYDRPNKLKVNM